MKILYASPEAVPFTKTGGLADVASALPKTLAQMGHEVTLILPKYRQVDNRRFRLTKAAFSLKIPIARKVETAEVCSSDLGLIFRPS